MDLNAITTRAFPEPENPDIQQSPPKACDATTSPRVLDTEAQGTVMMELIVDKLRLLDYERQFCTSRSPPWPRLHKFFFAFPSSNSNDNEQFLYFSTMAAWLFTRLGCHFPPPSESDDPTLICSKIMTELTSLGFAPPNWPPAELMQGHGDAVCAILDTLCSLVLDSIKYEFKPVTHFPTDDTITTTASFSPFRTSYSELYIIEATENHIDATQTLSAAPNPNLNANQWRLEVERIAPQLRIEVTAEGTDWRAHLEQARKLYEETTLRAGSARAQLQRFEAGVASSMEILQSHENFLNHDLEGLISEYVSVKGRLVSVEEKSGGIREATRKLAGEHRKVLEALEQVKQKMVEKGNEISDLSPLLQMKAAMQRLRLELQEMEVQIGVLEHSLMQVSIQQVTGGNTEEYIKE